MIVGYHEVEVGTNVIIIRGAALWNRMPLRMGGICSFACDEVNFTKAYLSIDADRVVETSVADFSTLCSLVRQH